MYVCLVTRREKKITVSKKQINIVIYSFFSKIKHIYMYKFKMRMCYYSALSLWVPLPTPRVLKFTTITMFNRITIGAWCQLNKYGLGWRRSRIVVAAFLVFRLLGYVFCVDLGLLFDLRLIRRIKLVSIEFEI